MYGRHIAQRAGFELDKWVGKKFTTKDTTVHKGPHVCLRLSAGKEKLCETFATFVTSW